MLLSPQCFEIACSPVLQFDAFGFRNGGVKRFAVRQTELYLDISALARPPRAVRNGGNVSP